MKPPFALNVSCCYGAPMGRRESRFEDLETVYLRRVPLNFGGYDQGGAYWGLGSPLWCAFTESGGTIYTRAASRNAAKAKIPDHPFFADGCKFAR